MKSHPSGLKIIEGGRRDSVELKGKTIHLVTERPAKRHFELNVVEDDTFRVFSAPTQLEIKAQHPVQVMTGLLYVEPLQLGTIKITKRVGPRTAVAIVYDSNLEDVTTVECLHQTWRKLWELTREFAAKTVYLPLLGAMHSSLPSEEILTAFVSNLPEDGREEIWLQLSEEFKITLNDLLQNP